MAEVPKHVIRRGQFDYTKVVLRRVFPVLSLFRFKPKKQMSLGDIFCFGRV